MKDKAPIKRSGSTSPDPALFGCCNNARLAFFKCPGCAQLMCFCSACQCLFPDLRNCGQIAAADGCPRCQRAFKDDFLTAAGAQVSYQDLVSHDLEHLTYTGSARSQGSDISEPPSRARAKTAVTKSVAPISSPSSSSPATATKSASQPPERAAPLGFAERWRRRIGNYIEGVLASPQLRFVIIIALIVVVVGPLGYFALNLFKVGWLAAGASGIYSTDIAVGGKQTHIEILLTPDGNIVRGNIHIEARWLPNQPAIDEAIESGNIDGESVKFQSRENITVNSSFRKITFNGNLGDRVITGRINLHFPELDLNTDNFKIEAIKK